MPIWWGLGIALTNKNYMFFIWIIVGIAQATKCAYGLDDKGYPIETDKEPWIND